MVDDKYRDGHLRTEAAVALASFSFSASANTHTIINNALFKERRLQGVQASLKARCKDGQKLKFPFPYSRIKLRPQRPQRLSEVTV